ncbi:MAG: hypothetical protein A2053_03725 [Deltaproteobacteria bacterium GWA2_50_8]|nr:MAG: hypothetical protein A2053_03725 [Deltaproteobacteria bacterium GWA2_50_8]
MKIRMTILGLVVSGVFLIMGGVCSTLYAGDPVIKVAVVDFQLALNNVEQGKKAKAALKIEFDSKQKKLDLMQKELQTMKEDIEKQRVVLSESSLRSKEEIFKTKFLDLQQKINEFRQELATREAQATGEILKKLRDLVADLGEKRNYDLIVEKSQDLVLYAKTRDDLTQEVISLFNKMNK